MQRDGKLVLFVLLSFSYMYLFDMVDGNVCAESNTLPIWCACAIVITTNKMMAAKCTCTTLSVIPCV